MSDKTDANITQMLANIQPRLVDISEPAKGTAQVLLVPNGMNAVSINEYLDKNLLLPKRRKGTIKTQRLTSFNDVTNRFKNESSAVFAAATVSEQVINASVTTILNYHPANGVNTDAQHGDHRVEYNFPVSKELLFWLSNNGKAMTQADFALMLEERINEMTVATDADRDAILNLSPKFAEPLEILELSKRLTIYSEEATVQSVNLSSGEKEIRFSSEHKDAQGKPVKVPDFFMIRVPLFTGEKEHRIAVRLRYRKAGAGVLWYYDLYRLDVVFQTAFEQALEAVKKETGLPLFLGSPE